MHGSGTETLGTSGKEVGQATRMKQATHMKQARAMEHKLSFQAGFECTSQHQLPQAEEAQVSTS
jgi:hypothetical protein